MTWTYSSRQSMSSALIAVEDDEEEVIVDDDEEIEIDISFLPVSGFVEEEDQELEEEVVAC